MSKGADFFTFDDNFLTELAGSAFLLKQAEILYKANAVEACEWDFPLLSGQVVWAEQSYYPKLNLKSRVLPECKCPCSRGRKGNICEHALALCFYMQANAQKAVAVKIPEARLEVRGLQLSKLKGEPLSFIIHLPPNLHLVAPKDAILCKFEAVIQGSRKPLEEINRGRAYHLESPAYEIAALLENWCQGEYWSLLQLTRERLLRILQIVKGQSIVFFKDPNQPLVGVQFQEVMDVLEKAVPAAIVKSVPQKSILQLNREATGEEASHHLILDGSFEYLKISLPGRSSLIYYPALDLLKQHGFILDAKSQVWWLRDRYKILQFLANHYQKLVEDWKAILKDSFKAKAEQLHFVNILTKTKEDAGCLEVEVKLDLDEVPLSVVQQVLHKGQFFIEYNEKIYLMPQSTIAKLAEAEQLLAGDLDCGSAPSLKKKLKMERVVELMEGFEELSINFNPPEEWAERAQALTDRSKLQAAPFSNKLSNTLRPYQHLGVAWMWHLYKNCLGGVLADEMGLGKTVQALALLTAIYGKSISKPSLIVCPAGLIYNWKKEAEIFCPELKMRIHHREQRVSELDVIDQSSVIITSYNTLARDAAFFEKLDFEIIIADEAQHIKNRKTLNAKALIKLKAQSRFVLTGTPIENSMEDLRSLFEFLMPGYLSHMPAQMKMSDREWHYKRIRAKTIPYILRRSKAMVAPELPEKIEQTIYCKLEPRQQALYEKYRIQTENEIASLEYAGVSSGRIQLAIFKQILRLRQICADPRVLDRHLEVNDSAKLGVLKELLEESLDGDHRVLIFSQFVEVLQNLKEELTASGVKVLYMDGQTKNRLALCEEFNSDESIKVFLISLKAGGVGLNLTGADTVIHYDPWWNPAVQAQATDRAHRIGQKKIVTSIRLIAQNTIEERVLTLQRSKAHLLETLFDESEEALSEIAMDEKGLSIEELKNLL